MNLWENLKKNLLVLYFFKHKLKFSFLFILLFFYWLWLPSQLFKNPYSTVLVDETNQLIAAQIANDGQWRFPQIDSVPIKFKKCIVTFEDEYFYKHPGFNPVSILKSIKRNASSNKIKSGGSTITMQVARMMRHNRHRSYIQKLIEIALAIRIELSYKKLSILNIYASNAPFGSNVVGLQAASWRYFGRSADKLTWAESALLAVLPNSPSLIYPGKNQTALLKKRNRLLKKLNEKNIIDNATYNLSLQEELPQKPYPIPQIAPHLLNRCISENGKSKLFQTTINKNLQVQVTDLLNKHMQNLSGNQINNACALVVETETGNVLAYVGNSFSLKNEHENFVDIINSPRSTGSILKPYLYAFMLNENKILPASLLEDVPTQIGSYSPKNFNLTYDGLVPANQAIARSLNIPAVKMLKEYGAEKFHFRLKQLGFKTFTKPTTHYGLSLILGGGEATLWDVCGAYASLGRTLITYNNVRNKYAANNYHSLNYLKNNIFEKQKASQSTDLLNAASIWSTFSAMTELLRPQDYVGWMQFLSKNKIAWKTGTSFGFRDAWAVGLNAKYTVAIWVGNADGEGRPDLTGNACAAPLMFSIFNILGQKTWFTKPTSDFIKLKVCKQSGYKANTICPDVILQDVKNGAEKTNQCPFHKLIHLDETKQFRVNSSCYEVNKMQHLPWFVVSPTQEYFFKQHSLFYRPLPSYLANCTSELSINQLDIIYPREGFKIYVPITQSGKRETCIFKATHKNNTATLFWHLDGEYVGSTQKYHQLSVLPNTGKHTLVVTDSEGESRECKFELIEKE